MATRKKAGKKVRHAANSTARGKPVQLPDGYKVLEIPPSWDCEQDPIIKGIRGETKEMTFGRGTKEEYDAECFIVQDETIGPVVVWKSGRLIQLFDETDEGDDVYIEFIGYGKAKAKDQNPPKLFRCGSKPANNKRNPF